LEGEVIMSKCYVEGTILDDKLRANEIREALKELKDAVQTAKNAGLSVAIRIDGEAIALNDVSIEIVKVF